MNATDLPRIRIDGVEVSPSWSLTRQAALAGMAITWGRFDHSEPAYPAQLKLSVIDTDGHLDRSAQMVGRLITVTRGDGRIIFRGRLDDFEITYLEMLDQQTNLKRRVWRLDLSAADKLAELARMHLRGPENIPADTPPEGVDATRDLLRNALGPGFWWQEKPVERIAAVMAAGANQAVAAIEWYDPFPYVSELARFRRMSDKLSALDMIESLYAVHPFGYANYVPATNSVTIGYPVTTAGLELQWDGDLLTIDLTDGHVVPASSVAVPAGYTARTGIQNAIDIVQITAPQITSSGGTQLRVVDVVLERETSHLQHGLTGRNEMRRANDVMYSLTIEEGGGEVRFQWPFSLDNVNPDNEFRTAARPTHDGIDFPEAGGTAITAMGDGVIVVSEFHSGWGNHVRIDHGQGLLTLYAHMVAPGLPVGTNVSRGDTIGHVGNTGNSFGEHLHLETWVSGDPMNPRLFMDQFAIGGPTGGSEESEWHDKLADTTVAIVEQLNDLVELPTIRFDWRLREYPPAVTDALIDTYSKFVPLFFPGSVFNVMPDAAVVHQVLGGVLVYDGGWYLDANTRAALHTKARILWNALVTIPEPTWEDFDPDIRFADIGDVTRGVTA